jgi:hypothetical protein
MINNAGGAAVDCRHHEVFLPVVCRGKEENHHHHQMVFEWFSVAQIRNRPARDTNRHSLGENWTRSYHFTIIVCYCRDIRKKNDINSANQTNFLGL